MIKEFVTSKIHTKESLRSETNFLSNEFNIDGNIK